MEYHEVVHIALKNGDVEVKLSNIEVLMHYQVVVTTDAEAKELAGGR